MDSVITMYIIQTYDLQSRLYSECCHVEIVHKLLSSFMEAHICCTKFLSKACVEQYLETVVHICDKAHIY